MNKKEPAGHAKKVKENKTNNFVIFLVAVAFFLIAVSESSLATPTILSDYGSNVRSKSTGNLLNGGDLTVMIYTQEEGGVPIYTESFENAINDGTWRVTLGLSGNLDLDYMTRYYKSYEINDELVIFTDYLEQETERIAFDSPYGYTSANILPECDDGELTRYNSSTGNWTCSLDLSEEELPSSCDPNDVLKYNGLDWDCGEDNITDLPVCAEGKVLKTNLGNWDCGDDDDTQLNESQISDLVGNWASDMVNYYTKDEVDDEFSAFVPSVSYNNLADLPANIDTDSTDDFSGNYGDLSGIPDTSLWDTNSSDDFTGIWEDLTSVPSDIADGDDVLSNETVFSIVNNSGEYYTRSQLDSQISAKQDELTGLEALFNGWDKDSSDDFTGNWSNISGIPEDIADGDDVLSNETVIAIINHSGFASESYVNSQIFSGSWNDLSDIPVNLDTDATDDFSGNYGDLTGAPNTSNWDINASNDFDGTWAALSGIPADISDGDNDTILLPSDVVNMVGNWSEDKNDYYTITEIDLKDFVNSSALIGLVNETYFNATFARINYSEINNTPDFTGWDTNAGDDFDGTWLALSGIPADISDGDNDTTYVFNDGFIMNGNEINLSLNTSFLAIKNGKLTLGDSETCGLNGMELEYNCSSDTWEWANKETYLLDTGDTATGSYTFDDGTFQIDANTNKIGIGTKDPYHLLHVETSSDPQIKFALNLQNPNSTIGNTSVGILFTVDSNSSYGKGALVYQRNQSNGRGDFHFLQEYHATAVEPTIDQAVMTIKNNGNVGIGDKNPIVKLDVNGAIRIAPSNVPGACDADLEGAIYYNITSKFFLGCNGTEWVRFN